MFPVFCPSGWLWNVSSANCIKLINDKMSWEAARNECRSMGPDLMKILDSKTNEFVTSKATFHVLNEMYLYKPSPTRKIRLKCKRIGADLWKILILKTDKFHSLMNM